MSLKAGRVGVRPDQVNLDGSITQSASGAYTKSESDNKFLAKTDAASTYLSKSDASSTYAAQTAVHDWVGYSKDVMKEVSEEQVKVGTIYYYINTMLKMFVVRFTGNAQECPTGLRIDFTDVLPANVRPSVEFDGYMRGSNNVLQAFQDGTVGLGISQAAAWLAGTVTGILNTGVQ